MNTVIISSALPYCSSSYFRIGSATYGQTFFWEDHCLNHQSTFLPIQFHSTNRTMILLYVLQSFFIHHFNYDSIMLILFGMWPSNFKWAHNCLALILEYISKVLKITRLFTMSYIHLYHIYFSLAHTTFYFPIFTVFQLSLVLCSSNVLILFFSLLHYI